MKTHFLILSNSDFGHPISLSRSCDQIFSEDEAHSIAEDSGQDEITYLYRLEAVYRPVQHREIPEYLVEQNSNALTQSKHHWELLADDMAFGGTD